MTSVTACLHSHDQFSLPNIFPPFCLQHSRFFFIVLISTLHYSFCFFIFSSCHFLFPYFFFFFFEGAVSFVFFVLYFPFVPIVILSHSYFFFAILSLFAQLLLSILLITYLYIYFRFRILFVYLSVSLMSLFAQKEYAHNCVSIWVYSRLFIRSPKLMQSTWKTGKLALILKRKTF